MKSVVAVALLILFIMFMQESQAAAFNIGEANNGEYRIITIQGEIERGDMLQLIELSNTEGLPIRLVVLESGGGNAMVGIDVAAMIRYYGYSTLVISHCESACATIFFAGQKRLIMSGGIIGVHSPYTLEGEEGEEEVVPNKIGSDLYFETYGSILASVKDFQCAEYVMTAMYMTHPDDMYYITKDNADSFCVISL